MSVDKPYDRGTIRSYRMIWELDMNLARIALLVSVCLADGILLFKISPAVAAEIISDVAPPPLRAENIGHPRHGYVSAPGHWECTTQSYPLLSATCPFAPSRPHLA